MYRFAANQDKPPTTNEQGMGTFRPPPPSGNGIFFFFFLRGDPEFPVPGGRLFLRTIFVIVILFLRAWFPEIWRTLEVKGGRSACQPQSTHHTHTHTSDQTHPHLHNIHTNTTRSIQPGLLQPRAYTAVGCLPARRESGGVRLCCCSCAVILRSHGDGGGGGGGWALLAHLVRGSILEQEQGEAGEVRCAVCP